ncbi:hypothetical protein BS50DRAFT_266107 [Corynespora cassiicola Philippines]|uniref:Uncharacterized protein n=1 Tax=Corynespora cassiicola Philippines TaxID=1448308 RepID=A0A2T2NZ28_CORCC|nr:hypothetical protein BS50DRAFT_266107 [Corynespora cassiicola Philippines]
MAGGPSGQDLINRIALRRRTGADNAVGWAVRKKLFSGRGMGARSEMSALGIGPGPGWVRYGMGVTTLGIGGLVE